MARAESNHRQTDFQSVWRSLISFEISHLRRLPPRIPGYSRHTYGVQDGATVKLVYESRGEKLGINCRDLDEAIKEKIEEADLDPDQQTPLDKLIGRDYEIITADERLAKIAADFVEHCAARWESGKALFVCIGKITCARMYQLIMPRWKVKAEMTRAEAAEALRAGRGEEGHVKDV